MADIELSTADGPIKAVLETPQTPGPWGGIVLIHDILGVGVDAENNARMLAEKGYLALAPNLFSRGRVRCIPDIMRSLLLGKGGRAVRDILAARDYLLAQENCNGKVAVVGFCMGGGFALLASPQGFDASAPFYPSTLASYDKILKGACPVVASFGQLDPANIGSHKRLENALDKHGIDHDIKTYAGATHSFANVTPVEPLIRVTGLGYNAEATDDAWSRIFAFFDAHMA
ncbi:putative carboxymethylenebutenolidase [Gordonia effusa NBRC 100432]|uniref:Putative carboxymethylenebutenolidase n=1 Tax=Gordonia effusa NBRC 100432 TaxID=1077974 RepID=H0QVI8_9ACTN|nr:dienelactone hydrolase family protein [Gordonia effusa]GAB16865.1 putative carboxymethylenebutenolidase [Gordonia effusa NBRC 100432]